MYSDLYCDLDLESHIQILVHYVGEKTMRLSVFVYQKAKSVTAICRPKRLDVVYVLLSGYTVSLIT